MTLKCLVPFLEQFSSFFILSCLYVIKTWRGACVHGMNRLLELLFLGVKNASQNWNTWFGCKTKMHIPWTGLKSVKRIKRKEKTCDFFNCSYGVVVESLKYFKKPSANPLGHIVHYVRLFPWFHFQILTAESYITNRRNGCVKLRREEHGLGSEEPISIPTMFRDIAEVYPEVGQSLISI